MTTSEPTPVITRSRCIYIFPLPDLAWDVSSTVVKSRWTSLAALSLTITEHAKRRLLIACIFISTVLIKLSQWHDLYFYTIRKIYRDHMWVVFKNRTFSDDDLDSKSVESILLVIYKMSLARVLSRIKISQISCWIRFISHVLLFPVFFMLRHS